MIYGIALILLLVAVSGLIAYIGDKVGRHVGKRRISFFGLRPKHTSIIVTVVTGVTIVSVTLCALFLISKQARTSFFGIQKLVGFAVLKFLAGIDTALLKQVCHFLAHPFQPHQIGAVDPVGKLAGGDTQLLCQRAALRGSAGRVQQWNGANRRDRGHRRELLCMLKNLV